jgi:hypothetical protein
MRWLSSKTVSCHLKAGERERRGRGREREREMSIIITVCPRIHFSRTLHPQPDFTFCTLLD